MEKQLAWPRCKCGHIAQAHNRKLGQEPENYGCDECQCCEAYRFQDNVPQARRDALEAQRQKILNRKPRPSAVDFRSFNDYCRAMDEWMKQEWERVNS